MLYITVNYSVTMVLVYENKFVRSFVRSKFNFQSVKLEVILQFTVHHMAVGGRLEIQIQIFS